MTAHVPTPAPGALDARAAQEVALDVLRAALAQRAATASELRTIVGDAGEIAGRLRSLAYLFEQAVVDDGADTPLTAASYLVTDCIRTMAARLDGLEARAGAIYAPIAAERP